MAITKITINDLQGLGYGYTKSASRVKATVDALVDAVGGDDVTLGHNSSGVTIAKGTAVYLSGFDVTSGNPKILAGDPSSPLKAAEYVTTAACLDGADVTIIKVGLLTSSGLNTTGGGVTAGVTLVYMTSLGALSLTDPSVAAPQYPAQIVGVVKTKAASGTIWIDVKACPPADTKIGALASLTTTDKTSLVAASNEIEAEVDTNTAGLAATVLVANAAKARQQGALVTGADAMTPTASQVVLSRLFQQTPTGDTTFTLPSSASMIALIPGAGTGACFNLTIANLAAHAVTLTAGDGSTTFVGSVIAGGAAAGSATWTFLQTGAGTLVGIRN